MARGSSVGAQVVCDGVDGHAHGSITAGDGWWVQNVVERILN